MGLCFIKADIADDLWICYFFGFKWNFFFQNEINSVGSFYSILQSFGSASKFVGYWFCPNFFVWSLDDVAKFLEHSCEWIENCIRFLVIYMVGCIRITRADHCWLLMSSMVEWVLVDIRCNYMWCHRLDRRQVCCLLLAVSLFHSWRCGCIWWNNMQHFIWPAWWGCSNTLLVRCCRLDGWCCWCHFDGRYCHPCKIWANLWCWDR